MYNLYNFYINCEYYKLMMTICKNPSRKNFYKNNLKNELNNIYNLLNLQNRQEKIFTLQELSQYNGSMGKPAYIAVNGIVYDVSLNPNWGGGTHFGVISGKDLSKEFSSCHGDNKALLSSLPIVGKLST